MPRQRDYKAEYQRRIANALKRGLSRSQARGHARAGEKPIRAKPVQSDAGLETALRRLRETGNQSLAAKDAGVSAERFRRFLHSNGLAERRGKQWRIADNRTRRMTVITSGDAVELTLRDFEQASLNGKHLAAVSEFLRTIETDLLAPFIGQSVIDAAGIAHPLETDPNTLFRIDYTYSGSEEYHQIYRIIT
ncbi:hypothetical protein [Erythrobacter sp. T5W1-R]|uniref:hypothetical protein n=1 Tax=Erythrobacter sp. T5W1-R TaxID=3101752 RepID=UPI002AFEA318|nr:hypothetical protein [Erythrobacter sp. T5W1-R]